MKQRGIYEQENSESGGEYSYSLVYEHEKLKEKPRKRLSVSAIAMQGVFLCLSLVYFMAAGTALLIVPMILHFISINMLFFVAVGLCAEKIQGYQYRTVYTWLLFVSTLVLFFVSLMMLLNGRHVVGMVVAWIMGVCFDVVVYWWMRRVSRVRWE